MNSVAKKLKNLRKNFGFKKEELIEIEKMYRGQDFNSDDLSYKKLLQISKEYCNKYTEISNKEMDLFLSKKHIKVFSLLILKLKKVQILKRLFPVHGFIVQANAPISAVIGLVDLDGYGFINKNITFQNGALVKVERSNVFAMNVVVGEVLNAKKAKLAYVTIERNCWIGAGAKIHNDVTLGHDCVIGAGGEIFENISQNSLAVGRPGRVIKKIDKTYFRGQQDEFEKYENIKMDNLKKIYGKVPKEFVKVVHGEPFNVINSKLSKLYKQTKLLCYEYNNKEISEQRRQQILDTLFIHGQNFKVGKNINVDLLGTVVVGDNVTLGDNVTIGGNVFIGNNCEIKKDCIIFSSGHSVFVKERMLQFSLTKGFFELTQYDCITIGDNVCLGEGVIVAPNTRQLKSVPANKLVVKNKVI